MDITTFEKLFKSYYAELCSFANTYLQDVDASEEIVQSLFVKLWEQNSLQVNHDYKKAFFYTAVKNACLNQIKHIAIRETYKKHNEREMEAENYDPSEALEASELEDKIRESIDKLPEGRRKIFIMSRYEGLKYKEIADHLKISIKTVENQMGSALKQLKSDLAAYIVSLILIGIKYFS
ncbi:MAG: RNA polymerase sigma-70 factor [Putridiphycobacter sp.]|nr:RNA polymerase sigma-70 factor [Putridiphycobacter sp.]